MATEVKAITENIELDVDLMKQILDCPHEMPHVRLGAAVTFVDGIIKQLCPGDRAQFEEGGDGLRSC